jgi:hypothetical protein
VNSKDRLPNILAKRGKAIMNVFMVYVRAMHVFIQYAAKNSV